MTQTDSQASEQEKLMRYLYGELTEKEIEELEDRFFQDDELFYQAVELENNLVDRYAQGRLADGDLQRFGQALEKFPERRQKIANAVALQTFIQEENAGKKAAVPPQKITAQHFGQKLANFFTIKSPLIGSAAAALLLIFTIAGILLFLDNRRKTEALAQLENERQTIETLRTQISDSENRLTNLNSQLEKNAEESVEFIEALESEQEKNRQLQKELDKALRDNPKPVLPTPKPSAPIIASILLTQPNTGRDGDGKMKTASVGENTRKLAINLTLGDTVKKEDKLTILLNEKPFLENVPPRVSTDGKKSLSLTIPTANLPEGANKLTVIDSSGKEITKYIFNVDKLKE